MSALTLNLEGLKQGRLTILKFTGKSAVGGKVYLCGCYCGNLVEFNTAAIRHSKYPRQSCGNCQISTKYKSEHSIYGDMMGRCYNINNSRYASYGGRGIEVCQTWRADFLNFLVDVGFRPSKEHSLDRIDVNKGYSKDNCRWATPSEQNLNKRRTFYYEDIELTCSRVIRTCASKELAEQIIIKLRKEFGRH